jgi:hypothetical protein
MKKKKHIPIFIVEEHHEAFIAWIFAIQQGWMQAKGNCLYHVDEHSDMGTPRFNASVHDLNKGELDKVKRFAYQELNIASFIVPACYLEIFSQIYWIRQKHRKILHEPINMFVRSYNQAGKRLLSGKVKDIKSDIPNEDRKLFDYYLQTVDQLPSNKEVVLDIDLDYFSCSGNPNELKEIYIEITEEEQARFSANKYHRLNYCGLGRIETTVLDGRFYYVINNYNEIYPSFTTVSETLIEERIMYFIKILKEKHVSPSIITICRSRYSGYTPPNQWEYIETQLLSGLDEIYSIENIHLNQLV